MKKKISKKTQIDFLVSGFEALTDFEKDVLLHLLKAMLVCKEKVVH